jgi:hypothetical protein
MSSTKSINKSMTISEIQKELKASNIDYTGAKKKSDYVSLYMTNGLHNKDRLSTIPEEQHSALEPPLQVEAKIDGEELPLQMSSEAKEEVKEEVKDFKSIIVLEELIMSMTIMGHGCEDLISPWTKDNPISLYFKNNVRVYSKSCVPDVNSIGSITANVDIIKDVQRRFSNVPKSETASIISTYADEVRGDYMRDIVFNKMNKTAASLHPGFAKLSDFENLSRVSGLSAYLSNKNFAFYENSPQEKMTQSYQQYQYKTLGLNVTDIRLRKTAIDGSVSYEQIFNPTDSTYARSDMSNFNLIYKSGLTYILKDVLKRKDLVKPALENFGFTGRTERIMDLSLEQIYTFFQMVGVDYANIMDYTCRACSIGRIPQSLSNKIYSVEQKYAEKPIAFGLRSRRKRTNKRKQKTQKKYKI